MHLECRETEDDQEDVHCDYDQDGWPGVLSDVVYHVQVKVNGRLQVHEGVDDNPEENGEADAERNEFVASAFFIIFVLF